MPRQRFETPWQPDARKSARGESMTPTEMDRWVATRVKLRRAQMGISGTALAKQIGLTRQQVDKIEAGESRMTIGRLYDIARFLGTPPGWFFEGSDALRVPQGDGPSLDLLTDPGIMALAQEAQRLTTEQRRALTTAARLYREANELALAGPEPEPAAAE